VHPTFVDTSTIFQNVKIMIAFDFSHIIVTPISYSEVTTNIGSDALISCSEVATYIEINDILISCHEVAIDIACESPFYEGFTTVVLMESNVDPMELKTLIYVVLCTLRFQPFDEVEWN
jgi:hypothetical protein